MVQEFPKRTQAEFHAQPVGDELLIYSDEKHEAYCLNGIAARVWQGCDGETDVPAMTEALRAAYGDAANEELVEATLAELEEKGLIGHNSRSAAAAISRRRLVRNLGLAAAALVPMVMVPTPAKAYGGGGCIDCDDSDGERRSSAFDK